MKRILLGLDPKRRPIYLTPEMRRESHLHVIGASGTGKSKFLEQLIRGDIMAGHGVCVLDWHGALYQDVLGWLAYHKIGLKPDYRELVLVDLTQMDWVKPLNFFSKRGDDVSSQVNRRLSAVSKVWGDDLDEMPRFQRIARQLFAFSIEHNESLVNASHLLDLHRSELRQFAAATTVNGWVRRQWFSLEQTSKHHRDWDEKTESTVNRLGRFVESTTVKRTLGLVANALDIRAAMDRNAILLINLGSSQCLDREAARLFAALVLNQFFEAAMERAHALRAGESAPLYTFIADEFQQYLNDDMAAMLDEVRKGGLRIAACHQHLGHFVDNPRLMKSVFTNCRLRAVFGGLDYLDACMIANEMFLHDLNQRQVAAAYWHTVHSYEEQTRTVYGSSGNTSHGSGRGSGTHWASVQGSGVGSAHGAAAGVISDPGLGWFDLGGSDRHTTTTSDVSTASQFSSGAKGGNEATNDFDSATEGWTETEIPVWVPIPKQELASETVWNREEKLSKIAELLKEQMMQHCFIKLLGQQTQPLLVPFVRDRLLHPDNLVNYLKRVHQRQGSIPGPEADRLLQESETRFLEKAHDYSRPADDEDIPAGAPVPPKRRR